MRETLLHSTLNKLLMTVLGSMWQQQSLCFFKGRKLELPNDDDKDTDGNLMLSHLPMIAVVTIVMIIIMNME